MDGNGRSGNGRFATGNPGGPGRPRRAVEREYLAALGDAVPLDTWKAICKRAADDALAGDAKARQWLAEILLRGTNQLRLSGLDSESAGDDAAGELAKLAAIEKRLGIHIAPPGAEFSGAEQPSTERGRLPQLARHFR